MDTVQDRLQILDRELEKLVRERVKLIESQPEEFSAEGSSLPFRAVDELNTKDVRVVYQGVEGAYSHQALRTFFGKETGAFAMPSFESAVSAVSSGLADYGVLPIENTTGGSVGDVLDLIVKYDCTTAADLDLPIRHVLLGLPGADPEQIREVYSHPQGLMQCSDYLELHRDWARVPVSNTAAGAKRLMEMNDPSCAAIAGELCGELYGLDILAREIANDPKNTTRFIVICREKIFRKDARKFRLCFECRHRTGALYRVLSHITYHGINMTKIESRPLPGRNFEYRFFVECEGNLEDPNVRSAIAGVASETGFCRVMGNY